MQAPELLRRLLEDPELKRAKERLVRYLAAYKVVEGNLGLFDRLARCRDLHEFLAALQEAMRVKERVLRGLEEGLRRGELRLTFQCDNVRQVFDIGSDDVERILGIAKDDPRLVGTVLATLALAYGGIQPVEREGARGGVMADGVRPGLGPGGGERP